MNLRHVIFIGLLTGVLTSCIKEPAEEAEIPSSAEEIATALGDSWGQADPLTMAPGDFVFQETEQRIDSVPKPFFVLQEGITVSKKEEREKDYLYTYLYQSKVYQQDSEGAQSSREEYRTVGKANPGLAAAKSLMSSSLRPFADDYHLTLGFERLVGLAYACAKTDELEQYCQKEMGLDTCNISCSNLKTVEEVVPVPELIKAQPNCGGFANCNYTVRKISFDWTLEAVKGDSSEKNRVNYSISMSPDMPFLSRVTEYCYRQLYTVQSQKLLVLTCTKLKNFKRGGS